MRHAFPAPREKLGMRFLRLRAVQLDLGVYDVSH